MSVHSVSTRIAPSYGLPSGNNPQPAKPAVPVDDPPQKAASAPRRPASATGGSTGGSRSSVGVALYQRVSQYGNSEPSTSALLKSWNEIVQSGRVTDSAVANFAKTLSQSETPGLQSGVIDLTA